MSEMNPISLPGNEDLTARMAKNKIFSYAKGETPGTLGATDSVAAAHKPRVRESPPRRYEKGRRGRVVGAASPARASANRLWDLILTNR